MHASLPIEKHQLISHLQRSGITDARVLAAIATVPREEFVPPGLLHQAYDDAALPIGLGQTISQPTVVATMTQALRLNDASKVLEIGTGSGYQASILSKLARRVYSIERHKPLLDIAEERFARLRLRNVTAMVGDGMKGWPLQAPFDAIIVTAAAADGVPRCLLEQLAVGGHLVAPVGPDGGQQTLYHYHRASETDYTCTALLAVRFVPLLPEVAEESRHEEADINRLLAFG